MSMIEIKRMQAVIDALNERINALESALEVTKSDVAGAAAPVEATAKDLETKFTAMSKDLEEKINISVKATVEATLDATKTELKAFAKSLVPSPASGKKKAASPAAEEAAAQE